MFIILILIVQVSAEWVEISQQHYKKPIRLNYATLPVDTTDVETNIESKNRVYINNSMPEHHWNKGILKAPKDEIRREEFVNKAVVLNTDIPGHIPDKSKDIDRNRSVTEKVSKPVKVISHKIPNIVNRDVLKTSNTVINQDVESLTQIENPFRPSKYEETSLEVLNLSDITEDYATTAIENNNNRQTYAQATSRIPQTYTEITKKPQKIPTSHKNQVIMEDLVEDDWPINEGKYEYIVEIVPSNSNKRRVEIRRNTVRPSTLKVATEESKETTFKFSTPGISTSPRLDITKIYESNTQTTSAKKTTPLLVITTTPQSVIEYKRNHELLDKPIKVTKPTAFVKDNDEVSTEVYTNRNKNKEVTEIKRNKNESIVKNATIPTTDPDKVMIEEILKDEEFAEITLHKTPQSTAAVIKRVYPTKIVKVDKNGHEISKPDTALRPTKPSYMADITTTVSKKHKEESVYNVFNTSKKTNQATYATHGLDGKFNQKNRESEKGIDRTQRNRIAEPTPNSYHDEDEITISIEDYEHHDHGNHTSRQTPKRVTQEIPVFTTARIKLKTNSFFDENEESYKHGSYVTLQDKIPEFVTKEKKFEQGQKYESNLDTTENLHKETVNTDVPESVDTDRANKDVKGNLKSTENKPNESRLEDEVPNDDGDMRSKTLDTLVKVLKVITETISKNTRKNFNSKVRYLEDLKGTILKSIEDRIDAVFPDDDAPRRKSRSAEPRGDHVGFPSSESALMTISFLTFAVFLIKLVLQIIQAFKEKAMLYPTLVAAGVGRT